MWLIIAFATTGFLVGNLMGMSASSTVPSFLGLLFALLGGSLIAFLHKLSGEDRILAGKLVLALSLTCLLGVYSGLFINERELLTPKERRFLPAVPRVSAGAAPCADREHDAARENGVGDSPRSKYLAAGELSAISEIDWERQHGKLSTEDAYARLLAIASQPCPPVKP